MLSSPHLSSKFPDIENSLSIGSNFQNHDITVDNEEPESIKILYPEIKNSRVLAAPFQHVNIPNESFLKPAFNSSDSSENLSLIPIFNLNSIKDEDSNIFSSCDELLNLRNLPSSNSKLASKLQTNSLDASTDSSGSSRDSPLGFMSNEFKQLDQLSNIKFSQVRLFVLKLH